MTNICTGQAPTPLTRAQFSEREAITRLEAIAWDALQEGRKAPRTQVAGGGFANPTYELSVQWLDTHGRLKAAQKQWAIACRAAQPLTPSHFGSSGVRLIQIATCGCD
jgi:hypothetical protein